jgi:hypothetical protein
MSNIYYDPSEYGLEIFDMVEEPPDYDFNMLVVWKKISTGAFLFGEDSG